MEHWPLRHLVLRTPRLGLRPDDDDGLQGLVAVAHACVHPPETVVPRGRRTEGVRLVGTPSTLVRRQWSFNVAGYGADCRAFLGGISPG